MGLSLGTGSCLWDARPAMCRFAYGFLPGSEHRALQPCVAFPIIGNRFRPSGLSGPYAHAPCWLKVSLSLKLRCRAPQLPPAVFSGPGGSAALVQVPPAVFSGPKIGQGRKLVKKVKIWKVLRMGLPIVENLSGLQESIFSLSRRPQLHFGQKFKN